jgi:hypothetical protein
MAEDSKYSKRADENCYALKSILERHRSSSQKEEEQTHNLVVEKHRLR